MATFEISHASEAHACVAKLFGDIDTAVVPELRNELGESVDAGCINLVLDLTHVTYVDSSALGLLVWLDRRVSPGHGRVLLAGANSDVARILEISGLSQLAMSIAVRDTVASALDGLEIGVVPGEVLWRRQICIPADVNRLAGVRDEVSEMISPMGFTEPAVFDIKVALGEALANAVRHGSPKGGENVCIDVLAFEDRVVVEVRDNGLGFDGAHSASDDLYAPSGRGVMFMRTLMDRVEFEPAEGGGTMVRLVKHCQGGSG